VSLRLPLTILLPLIFHIHLESGVGKIGPLVPTCVDMLPDKSETLVRNATPHGYVQNTWKGVIL
jgi:hypothetical protein